MHPQKESTKSLVGGYYEKFNNEQEKTKILTQSLDKSVTEVGDLKAELDRRSHQVIIISHQLISEKCTMTVSQSEKFIGVT